jgi:zinc and cadmium transporter
MSTLTWVVIASLGGGLVSFVVALVVARSVRPHWVQRIVSYAIGALLAAAFLDILPHALQSGANFADVGAAVLAGILTFFVLEKLVLWRHAHGEHDHGESQGAALIVIGDAFHNFVDGILIASAFIADPRLGVTTALAIVAHEIPQEAANFIALLAAGLARNRALLLNLVCSMATLLGAIAGYYALQGFIAWLPMLLGFAAACMIYVAVADLIPSLHRRVGFAATVEQVSLIGLGVASVVLLGHVFD